MSACQSNISQAQPPWRGAASHPREAERLAALEQTGLLGGLPDQLQEGVVRLAAEICGTPISAVSLVEKDRQWFSAIHGLACRQTPREVAFCAHTILGNAPFVVEDATSDPRFAWNPLVTGEPGIRFYAGVPLSTPETLPLGSLCVIDTRPRDISPSQVESLRTLGSLVAAQLELYRRNRQLQEREAELIGSKATAEQALRETRALVSTLEEYSIVCEADAQGRIIKVNDALCELSGYSREELIGADQGVVNIGTRALECRSALQNGRAWRGESQNRGKHGRVYWLDSIVACFRDAAGNVEKYVSVNSDVTSRKEGEKALRQVSERFELAVRAGGVGTFSWESSSGVLAWDAQMHRLYGVARESFQGTYQAWLTTVHPEDRERADQLVQLAIRGEKPLDTEFRIVRPDGAVRAIRAFASVQQDDQGNPVRMIGTNWDVTEQREGAERLRAALESLEEAQTVARMGSWSYDLATGKITWSKVLYELFERDSAAGPPSYAEIMSDYEGESAARLNEAVSRAAEDGTPYSLLLRTSKGWGKGVKGGARFVRGEGRARCDSTGKIVGLYGTATDVTVEVETAESLRQARLSAEAANRAKSAFLANMSHEIRTPLTAILGFADLLGEEAESSLDRARRSQAIEAIRRAGSHLLTVINDILDLSKIEADKMTIERVEVPLAQVLSESESLMRPRAMSKGISLSISLRSPMPDRIMSDPTRLRQILMNLIGNAVKFTEVGSVRILVGRGDDAETPQIVVDVEDTGPGLSPEQAAQLFRPFGQADDTVTRKHGGTGLGLTVSRRLASLMGGNVVLLRAAPGVGSCFRVVLPLIPAAGASMIEQLVTCGAHGRLPGRDSPLRSGRWMSGRILLAEDGPDNQRLLKFHLTKAGAEVEIADNGRIALEMAERAAGAGKPYDLLLTDMQMPEMDGYTLARTLRERGSTLAIIALTAHAMEEDRERCIRAGCDDYASKPIDKHALLDTCARWLGRRGGLRESASAA